MKSLFAFQLILIIITGGLKLLLTFIRRYQPLFLTLIIALLIVFSLLLETILSIIVTSQLPSSYDTPAQGTYSQKQILELQKQWKLLDEIQPNSTSVKNQLRNIESSLGVDE